MEGIDSDSVIVSFHMLTKKHILSVVVQQALSKSYRNDVSTFDSGFEKSLWTQINKF